MLAELDVTQTLPEAVGSAYDESNVFPLILIYLSEVQPRKAPLPMLVTLLGIVIDVNEVQLEKASLFILVTLFGIVIDVSEVHLSKAASPILVTPLGISSTTALLTPLKSVVLFLLYKLPPKLE